MAVAVTHLLVFGDDVREEAGIDLGVVPALLKGDTINLARLDLARLV